jgi:hypothetical protein
MQKFVLRTALRPNQIEFSTRPGPNRNNPVFSDTLKAVSALTMAVSTTTTLNISPFPYSPTTIRCQKNGCEMTDVAAGVV